MRKIIAEIGKPITLGRIGENETTTIVFNLSRVAIPNATYSLIHKRHGDETSYPCETYIENGNLCWEVKSSDVAVVGMGECEVLAIVDEKVAKDEIYTTRVLKALDDNIGEVPPPYQPWVDSVLKEFAFSHKLENITCHYISIPHSAEPHCDSEETETGLILTFYIPMGADGKDGRDGKDGKDGADGFTPSASVTKTGSTTTITITDKDGTTSVEVKDGAKGDKGDTYNLTEQDKSEIASQIHYDDSELRAEIESKENVVNKADAITDLNKDSSVKYPTLKAVADYVADGNNLPKASDTEYGVIKAPTSPLATNGGAIYLKDGVPNLKTSSTFGVYYSDGYGALRLASATNNEIDNDRNNRNVFKAIVPHNLDYAVKQALCDGKGSPYTEAEKKSARERIGAEGEMRLIADFTLTGEDCKRNIFIRNDVNGNPFELSRAKIIIYAPRNTNTSLTNATGYIGIANSRGFEIPQSDFTFFGVLNVWRNDSENHIAIDVYTDELYPSYAMFNSDSPSIAYASSSSIRIAFGNKRLVADAIREIRSNKNAIDGVGNFAEGTRVIIYGIDK